MMNPIFFKHKKILKKMYGIFLSVIFILSFDQISAAEIYVSTTGNNSNTGTSWNSPKGVTFLQTLSATTVSANTTIYLKAGTYNYSAVNAISAATGFRLIGGFPATATGTDLTGYNPLANQTNIKFSGAGTSTPYEFLNATGSVNSMLIKGIRFEGEGNLTAGGFSHVIYYGTLGSLITIDLQVMDCEFFHFGNFTNGQGWQPFWTQDDGNYTFTNCYFHDNGAANDGAAIDILGGTGTTLTVNGCTFTNNKSNTGQQGGGGAVASVADTTTITNSSFCGNSTPSGSGGALGNGAGTGVSAGNWTVTNCTFSNNTSGAYTGGAFCLNPGPTGSGINTLTMSGCNFYSNSETSCCSGGGALSLDAGYLTTSITNCNFYNNSITTGSSPSGGGNQGGGAILFTGQSLLKTINISNCVFDSNAVPSTSYGGAIFLSNIFGGSIDTSIALSNVTFINNKLGTSTVTAGCDIGIYAGSAGSGKYSIANSRMQLSAANSYRSYAFFTATANNYTFGTGNVFSNISGGLNAPTFSCPSKITYCVAGSFAPILN